MKTFAAVEFMSHGCDVESVGNFYIFFIYKIVAFTCGEMNNRDFLYQIYIFSLH